MTRGDEIRAVEARHGIPTYAQLPITLIRGSGCHVEDTDGRRFLDFYGGHAVALTGHCHPAVVKAVQDQAARLLFYSNVVSNDVRAAALRDLTGTAPRGMSHAFLCNSGAEANEAALKLARKTTGRRTIVSMEGGFHGRTMGALSATELGHYLADYAPAVPGHRFIPFGDLNAAAAAIDDDTASVVLEPIQSMGGMRTASDDYLVGLRQLCSDRGALLHFDEVQTGPARTGVWWYGDHAGVVPDLISTAKGLGSGVPIGATLVQDHVAARVQRGDQGTTFGGGMLACAAVAATIHVIRGEDLLRNARERGEQIANAAAAVAGVRGIRGRGLLLGLVLDRKAKGVVAALRDELVLTGTTPGDANVLRLLPPLVIGDAEIETFLRALRKVLGGVRLLSLADVPGAELEELLAHAAQMKSEGPDPALLRGKSVVLLFLNPSLRTRTSMELAARSLGADVVTLVPGTDAWELELEPGIVMDGAAAEHLVDAARVLSEMADLIGVRTFASLHDVQEDRREPVLTVMANEVRVPLVNLESALDHPLQALADLLTLQEEFGPDLRDVPVTLTWAPHPRPLPMAVAAAFLRAASRMGMDVRVAAPPEFALPGFLLEEARAMLPGRGAVEAFESQRAAVAGARAVYAKSWAAPTLYGAPGDAGAAARDAHRDWMVDEALLAAGNDAVFMHCLPVRRNVVVTDAVLDGASCRVYREAGNRVHTARAVFARILGGA